MQTKSIHKITFLNIFCIFADILPNMGVEHGLSS